MNPTFTDGVNQNTMATKAPTSSKKLPKHKLSTDDESVIRDRNGNVFCRQQYLENLVSVEAHKVSQFAQDIFRSHDLAAQLMKAHLEDGVDVYSLIEAAVVKLMGKIGNAYLEVVRNRLNSSIENKFSRSDKISPEPSCTPQDLQNFSDQKQYNIPQSQYKSQLLPKEHEIYAPLVSPISSYGSNEQQSFLMSESREVCPKSSTPKPTIVEEEFPPLPIVGTQSTDRYYTPGNPEDHINMNIPNGKLQEVVKTTQSVVMQTQYTAVPDIGCQWRKDLGLAATCPSYPSTFQTATPPWHQPMIGSHEIINPIYHDNYALGSPASNRVANGDFFTVEGAPIRRSQTSQQHGHSPMYVPPSDYREQYVYLDKKPKYSYSQPPQLAPQNPHFMATYPLLARTSNTQSYPTEASIPKNKQRPQEYHPYDPQQYCLAANQDVDGMKDYQVYSTPKPTIQQFFFLSQKQDSRQVDQYPEDRNVHANFGIHQKEFEQMANREDWKNYPVEKLVDNLGKFSMDDVFPGQKTSSPVKKSRDSNFQNAWQQGTKHPFSLPRVPDPTYQTVPPMSILRSARPSVSSSKCIDSVLTIVDSTKSKSSCQSRQTIKNIDLEDLTQHKHETLLSTYSDDSLETFSSIQMESERSCLQEYECSVNDMSVTTVDSDMTAISNLSMLSRIEGETTKTHSRRKPVFRALCGEFYNRYENSRANETVKAKDSNTTYAGDSGLAEDCFSPRLSTSSLPYELMVSGNNEDGYSTTIAEETESQDKLSLNAIENTIESQNAAFYPVTCSKLITAHEEPKLSNSSYSEDSTLDGSYELHPVSTESCSNYSPHDEDETDQSFGSSKTTLTAQSSSYFRKHSSNYKTASSHFTTSESDLSSVFFRSRQRLTGNEKESEITYKHSGKSIIGSGPKRRCVLRSESLEDTCEDEVCHVEKPRDIDMPIKLKRIATKIDETRDTERQNQQPDCYRTSKVNNSDYSSFYVYNEHSLRESSVIMHQSGVKRKKAPNNNLHYSRSDCSDNDYDGRSFASMSLPVPNEYYQITYGLSQSSSDEASPVSRRFISMKEPPRDETSERPLHSDESDLLDIDSKPGKVKHLIRHFETFSPSNKET